MGMRCLVPREGKGGKRQKEYTQIMLAHFILSGTKPNDLVILKEKERVKNFIGTFSFFLLIRRR